MKTFDKDQFPYIMYSVGASLALNFRKAALEVAFCISGAAMHASENIIEALVQANAHDDRHRHSLREALHALARLIRVEATQEVQHNLDILCEPTENVWMQ